MVSLDTFLATIFSDVNEGLVCLVDARPDPQGRIIFPARRWRPGRSRIQGATYYCISTLREPVDGKIRRTLADVLRTYVVVLDDIGTKIDPQKFGGRAEPHYVMETSPGNYQWGYLIEPSAPDAAADVIHALAEAGWTDRGAQGKNRVVRVPGSINNKHGQKFAARVIEWHPDEPRWTLKELAAEFGVTPSAMPGGRSTDRPNYRGPHTDDPIFDWLQEQGHVIGPPNADGYASIECPWASEHTDPRSDARWAVGAGLTGAFKCFHAACEQRHTTDFLAWVRSVGGPAVADLEAAQVSAVGAKIMAKLGPGAGSRGRSSRPRGGGPEISTAGPKISALSMPPDVGALMAQLLDRMPVLRKDDLPTVERTASGGVRGDQKLTVENVGWVAASCGFTIAKNELAGEIEIEFDAPELQQFVEADRRRVVRELLTSQCQRLGISARTNLSAVLDALASGNGYHPLVEWIDDTTWDGHDYIADLAATLHTTDSEWRDIVVRRWCVQAAVAWTNWQRTPPISVPHVLVLCGPQGCGKTSWFRSLLPNGLVQTEAALHLDSVRAGEDKRKVLSSPIVELGELETTLGRSENGAMRSFLSNTVDRYRLPYDREITMRTRCTAFGASVNDPEFLLDPWGARRFWTVQVTGCNWRHGLDLRQLWAQAFVLMRQGAEWNLSGDREIALHSVSSDRHRVHSYAESLLDELEIRRQTIDEVEWTFCSAAEVAGYYRLQQPAHWRSVGRQLRTLFGDPSARSGKRGWYVPLRKHELVTGYISYAPGGGPKLKVVK